MPLTPVAALCRFRGFTLLEVLITLIILAIGILGLANLQSKIHLTEVESYQRAQAVLLLQDMVDRINSNRGLPNFGADYVTVAPLGVDDPNADCTAMPTTTQAELAARDRCEWGNSLRGAAEKQAGVTNVGAMIGARGCVELVQAADPTAGVCRPAIYRVTIAWQGLYPTAAPNHACAQGMYGADDSMRRAVAVETTIGLPRCGS